MQKIIKKGKDISNVFLMNLQKCMVQLFIRTADYFPRESLHKILKHYSSENNLKSNFNVALSIRIVLQNALSLLDLKTNKHNNHVLMAIELSESSMKF